MSSDKWLFPYGTLGDPAVQIATFSRLRGGHADTLLGCKKVPLEITDPHVVRTSCTEPAAWSVASIARRLPSCGTPRATEKSNWHD